MEKPIQILLVEDELIIADFMQQCLTNLGYEVVEICINYEEAVDALARLKPDIALIDITLKGNKTGIELGNYIKQHFSIPFVFATSHNDKITIDLAKQTMPYAYLIKPFNEEDLYAVIETAMMHYGRQKQKEKIENEESLIIINDGIFIKNKGRFMKLKLENLLYIEANDNYSTLITTNGNYSLKTTLKSLLEALPLFFWRIHRSYVINLHHLKSFDTEEVIVLEKHLPIGKSFYPLLIEKLRIING